MNPINRATAQRKRLSPVWKFVIENTFEVSKPYRKIETDTHIIVVEEDTNISTGLFEGFAIRNKRSLSNDYGIDLGKNERIIQAIPKEELQTVEYLYYDDPEETEEERAKYIMSLDIQRKAFKYQFDTTSTGRELKTVEYVKKEPFTYQHGLL